ncbi:MAG: hypothetical protein IT165_00330 [Bryobacterales bacterium]|nr:hypothetical protein [Bryobacterales bacterium]
MLWTLLLAAQATMALPPLGFFHGPDDRLYPVYGMRGNFLVGDPLPEAIRSAATFGRMSVWKLPGAIRVSETKMIAAPDGRAVFAWDEASDTLAAWIRESRQMMRWSGDEGSFLALPAPVDDVTGMAFPAPGMLRMVWKGDDGIRVVNLSLDTERIASQEEVPGQQATLDSNGNVWRSDGEEVFCGERHWTLAEPLVEFSSLADGWVILRTESTARVARCGEPELFQLPIPMP